MKYFSERHLSMKILTRNDAYDDKQDFSLRFNASRSCNTALFGAIIHSVASSLPFLYHTYSIMSMICLTNKLSIEFTRSGARGDSYRWRIGTGGFSPAQANAARISVMGQSSEVESLPGYPVFHYTPAVTIRWPY